MASVTPGLAVDAKDGGRLHFRDRRRVAPSRRRFGDFVAILDFILDESTPPARGRPQGLAARIRPMA